MPPPGKRPLEVIDLTGDGDGTSVRRYAKSPRLGMPSSSIPSHRASPGLRVSSSQASRPSQRLPAAQPVTYDPEQEVYHLTQRLPASQTYTYDPELEVYDFTQRLPASQTVTYDPEPEIYDLIQCDDGPPLDLYGTLGTYVTALFREEPLLTIPKENKVVGVRYYNGDATAGEVVVCKREPQNEVCHAVEPSGREWTSPVSISSCFGS